MKYSEILFEETFRFLDHYDEHEIWDETEMLHNYVDEEDLNRDFEVKIMTPEEAKQLKTPHDDTTVWEAYHDFADEEQIEWVEDCVKNWDENRVVIVCNSSLIDGNHHTVAGIIANRPIKYINLAD